MVQMARMMVQLESYTQAQFNILYLKTANAEADDGFLQRLLRSHRDRTWDQNDLLDLKQDGPLNMVQATIDERVRAGGLIDDVRRANDLTALALLQGVSLTQLGNVTLENLKYRYATSGQRGHGGRGGATRGGGRGGAGTTGKTKSVAAKAKGKSKSKKGSDGDNNEDDSEAAHVHVDDEVRSPRSDDSGGGKKKKKAGNTVNQANYAKPDWCHPDCNEQHEIRAWNELPAKWGIPPLILHRLSETFIRLCLLIIIIIS